MTYSMRYQPYYRDDQEALGQSWPRSGSASNVDSSRLPRLSSLVVEEFSRRRDPLFLGLVTS